MSTYKVENQTYIFLKNPKMTKAVLLLSGMLTIMAGALISPDLPRIQAYFAAVPSIAVITPFILTIVALSIIIVSPFIGGLIGKVGKRRIFLVSLVLYAIGGSGGLYLDNIWAIMVSRVVLAVAVGVLTVCTMTLAADYFHGNERREFMGFLSASMSLGAAIFIFASGYLADIGWRLPFMLYLFSLIILPFAFLFIPEIKEVTKKRTKKVTVEKDSAHPMQQRAALLSADTVEVDKQAPPKSELILIFVLPFLSMVFLYIMTVQMPFYVEVLAVGSSFISGIIITAMNILQTFAGIFYGRSVEIKPAHILEAFFLFESLGFLIISIASSTLFLIIGASFCGFGMGITIAASSTWVPSIAPDKDRDKYIIVLNMMIYSGQFLSPIIAMPFVNIFGYSAPYGFFTQVGILCLSIFIIAVLTSIISSKKGKRNFFTVRSITE